MANKGGRMDIRIMYYVKQKFWPTERSGWKMCLNPKSLEIINPTTPNKGWLVADNGDRMDISIMYCVKQNFRLNRWLG